MIELSKTRRLTIASVVFALIIVVGLITLRKPDYEYTISVQQMLDELNTPETMVSLSETSKEGVVLIDLRHAYDFNSGTLENAISIPVSDILNEEVISMFDALKNESKTLVLFSYNVQSATAPWMLLKQIGYSNLKLLSAGYDIKNAGSSLTREGLQPYLPEQAPIDFAQAIKGAKNQENLLPRNEPTQIVPIKRNKKSAAAGGC